MQIRASTEADLPAVTAIYAHWVTHGRASFELEPPPLEEMARRRAAMRHPMGVDGGDGGKVGLGARANLHGPRN